MRHTNKIKTFEAWSHRDTFLPYTGPQPPHVVFGHDQFEDFYEYLEARLNELHEERAEPISCTWWFYSLRKGSRGPGFPMVGAHNKRGEESWKGYVKQGYTAYLFDMDAANPGGRRVEDLLRLAVVDKSGTLTFAATNDDYNPHFGYTILGTGNKKFRDEMQRMVDATTDMGSL